VDVPTPHWFYLIYGGEILKKLKVKGQAKLNVMMILVSLASLLFMGKKDLKRFFPASIFIFFIEMLTAFLGKKQKWWIFFNKPNAFWFNEFPLEIGPVLASSFWMLKFGAGNFKRFITMNFLLQLVFVFPISMLARNKNYYSLVKINSVQLFFYFFPKSFILYGVQKLFDKNYKPVE
jgi:hypothetical protein